MKKLIYLLFLLSSYNLFAQTTSPSAQTFIWKISGGNLKNDIFIQFVTTNICSNDLQLSAKSLEILSKTDIIRVETGLNDPSNEAVLKKMVVGNNPSESVKNILSSGLYDHLVAAAAQVGMNELRLNSIKPVFISGLITKIIYPCQLKPAKTIETLVREYAAKKSIPVKELVPLDDVFHIFNAYPKTYWERNIDFLINDHSQAIADLDTKASFYLKGNYRGTCAIINKSPLLNEKYEYKDIELERMSILISKIKELPPDKSSYLLLDIVDVANPATSLFTLLTKAGYTVSPITE